MTVVRAIAPSDREAWARLFTHYGASCGEAFSEMTIAGVWRWLMDEFHEVSAVVAVDDDRTVIGFAHYRRTPDTFTARDGWVLDDLFVEPSSRGQGVGSTLIDAVAERITAKNGRLMRWTTLRDHADPEPAFDGIGTRTAWVTYERNLD